MSDLRDRLQAALGDIYRIERELTGGGMSRLFLCHEASLNRQVVVKLLPPELTSEVSAARFKQEIELAAHLQHPNILPVLTAGARDDLLYYVMPYVPGESLRHRLTREGKLPVPDAVRILSEVADALAYAHAEGVIHRDIKPENILLEGSHAVLTDFGVARALVEAKSGGRVTDTGIAVGTPAYMSPEQAAGERHIDARTDVYALAVVGYEMLAGAPPFAGPTAQALIAAHLTTTPRPLIDVRRETPPAVSNAIQRALAKDPGARLRTAAEFRDALGAAYGPTAPRRRLSKRARFAVATGGVALLAAGAILVTRSRSVAPLDPNLVAVAPFDVLAPGLELWREGLVDILSRNLDGAGPLRTVSPTIVVRRWSGRADPASAAELGRKTGARLAVFGQLVGTRADSVRLTGRLLDVATGRTLGEVEIRDLSANMDRLADSLTVALLRELGRTRPIGAVRLASLGSTSLPALKAFLQGEQFYRRTAWDSARTYYGRAVALDSSFALALRRMYLVLWWRVRFDSAAQAYALKAGALNQGLAPRESLLVTADSLFAALDAPGGDTATSTHVQRLFATLEEATRRYPDDPEVWYELGEAREHWWLGGGRTPQKVLEAFDRAIALDSTFAPAYIHAVELAIEIGGPAAALRYTAAYQALNPTDANAAGIRVAAKLLDPEQGRSREVERLLDTVSADALANAVLALSGWVDSAETALRLARKLAETPRGPFVGIADSGARRFFHSRTLAFRGHLHEAARIVGTSDSVLYAILGLLGAVRPDTIAAVFRRWLRQDRAALGSVGLAFPWWTGRGDITSLREAVTRADSTARATPHAWERDRARYLSDAGRAYLALAARDTADALRRFAPLPETVAGVSRLDRLAQAQLLASQRRDREAAMLLERELGEFLSPAEALWLLERGRVNERLGNREKAITAYRFVADVWRHADPELQPYVEEAKAALKRLRGEPRR